MPEPDPVVTLQLDEVVDPIVSVAVTEVLGLDDDRTLSATVSLGRKLDEVPTGKPFRMIPMHPVQAPGKIWEKPESVTVSLVMRVFMLTPVWAEKLKESGPGSEASWALLAAPVLVVVSPRILVWQPLRLVSESAQIAMKVFE